MIAPEQAAHRTPRRPAAVSSSCRRLENGEANRIDTFAPSVAKPNTRTPLPASGANRCTLPLQPVTKAPSPPATMPAGPGIRWAAAVGW